MKKHIVAILIIILILALAGTGIWFVMKRNNIKPLYKANCEFTVSKDTSDLCSKMTEAQTLYNMIFASETRLTTLQSVILKLDSFDKDLNSYLVLLNKESKTSKKLSKSYADLIKTRKSLITDYDEYIVRMSGNINADGTAVQNLYNELFNKTVDYLYKYNKCFNLTSTYVFDKIYKADNIKEELYTLYSLSVNNLLNNISNNRFNNTTLITRLNNGIRLLNNNLHIIESVKGGEFSVESIKFQQYFNHSSLTVLIDNFNTYYAESINPNVETSNEKLAVYYAKQILEI